MLNFSNGYQNVKFSFLHTVLISDIINIGENLVRCAWCFPDKWCISQLFTFDHWWYKNLHLTLRTLLSRTVLQCRHFNFFVSLKCVCYSSFIGEESVAAGEGSILTDNPTWIIDPIDGTTNFVHRSTFHFFVSNFNLFSFSSSMKVQFFSLLNCFKRDILNLLVVTSCYFALLRAVGHFL